MGKTLNRHNVLFYENEYQEIKDYCKKVGVSVSQFIREIAISKVREAEDRNLLEFINRNCGYVENEEQKEIENFMETYKKDKEDFSEVSLDDIQIGRAHV